MLAYSNSSRALFRIEPSLSYHGICLNLNVQIICDSSTEVYSTEAGNEIK